MKTTFAALLLVLVPVINATAQTTQASETKKTELTAEQVLEKYLAAIGGREALAKIASYELKSDFEMPGRGVRGTMEIYGKAPDRMLTVKTIDRVGVIKQGYDGRTGWSQDPYQGLRELTGEELETVRSGAVFNAELKWRELFEKVELLGAEKLKQNEVYAVQLTAKDGSTEIRYYGGNYLLLRSTTVYEGPQGRMPIETHYADYRESGGIKTAFEWRQQTPVGDTVIKVTDVRHNAQIDDARFAKPAVR